MAFGAMEIDLIRAELFKVREELNKTRARPLFGGRPSEKEGKRKKKKRNKKDGRSRTNQNGKRAQTFLDITRTKIKRGMYSIF